MALCELPRIVMVHLLVLFLTSELHQACYYPNKSSNGCYGNTPHQLQHKCLLRQSMLHVAPSDMPTSSTIFFHFITSFRPAKSVLLSCDLLLEYLRPDLSLLKLN